MPRPSRSIPVWFVVVLTAATCPLGLSAADDPVALRWKFPLNTSRGYVYTYDQKTGEGPMAIEVHVTQKVTEQVTRSEGTSGTLAETVKSTQLTSKGLLGESQYDSSKGAKVSFEEDPLAAPFAAMTGATVSMQMTEIGEVTAVTGVDAIVSGFGPAASIASSSISDTYRSFGILLPVKPLKVGDSWTQKRQMKTPVGEITATIAYFYKGRTQFRGHDCAKIKKVMVTGGDLLERMGEVGKAVDQMAEMADEIEKQMRAKVKATLGVELPQDEGDKPVEKTTSAKDDFPMHGILHFDIAGGYVVQSTVVSLQAQSMTKAVRSLE